MKYLPLFYIFALGSAFALTKFELYTAEATVAYVMNAPVVEVKPDNPAPQPGCTCGGTGRVKTGDGINTTECPCGPNCPCKNKNKPTVPNKRVLFFTSAKNCSPCQRTEKEVFPVLKKVNWTIGAEPTNLIQVFDYSDEKTHEMFDKYDAEYQVPTYVLIEGDKVIRTSVGFMNAKQFGHFFYGK